MEEIWKDIPGYEGSYQVSNMGRVRSLPRKRARQRANYKDGFVTIPGVVLKPFKDRRGYPKVRLYPVKNRNQPRVHQLVAEAFIPNPENKRTVNHINGVKDDNRLENLEWATDSENIKHSFDIGTRKYIVGSGKSKLKPHEVLEIRRLFTFYGVSQKDIHSMYSDKISFHAIKEITCYLTWKDLRIL